MYWVLLNPHQHPPPPPTINPHLPLVPALAQVHHLDLKDEPGCIMLLRLVQPLGQDSLVVQDTQHIQLGKQTSLLVLFWTPHALLCPKCCRKAPRHAVAEQELSFIQPLVLRFRFFSAVQCSAVLCFTSASHKHSNSAAMLACVCAVFNILTQFVLFLHFCLTCGHTITFGHAFLSLFSKLMME